MEEFERKLKELSVGRPSPGLRGRIFGARIEEVGDTHPPRRRWFGARMPLGWAALLMLTTGLAGYLAGGLGHTASAPIAQVETGPSSVHVIFESAETRNMFDLTQTSPDFVPGDVTISVETNGEA